MSKYLEMLQKRAKLITDARDLANKAVAENRALTGEEQAKVDAMFKDADSIKQTVDTGHRADLLTEELEKSVVKPAARTGQPDMAAEHRDLFRAYLRGGMPEANKLAETRGVEITDLTKGGYLRPPQEFVNQFIKGIDDLVWMRRIATVMNIGDADSMGAPALTTDMGDADWTTEIGSVTEDTALRFAKRELTPHQLTKLQKISLKAVSNPVFGTEAFIRQRLDYKFALTLEKGYLTGTGASQPLGVFTASAQGISTSRDVSTGNTATEITFAGLKAAQYTLKQQYRMSPSIAWLFHRDAVAQIAKIVDGNGQYLWQPSVQIGQPDRLLGYPVYESENAPNTFTTLLYVGLLGDFSFYWIADSGNLEIQRLVELYAANNQVGFIGRWWSDGMPVLEEAFVRVKLG